MSDNTIEVFIVTNDENKNINGYAEVSAVANLLAPFIRISSTQLWNTTHGDYKIQNNGKNFIHAIAICKYLSSIPETDSENYKNLRRLVRDLITGDTSVDDDTNTLMEMKDEINERLDKLFEQNANILSDFNGLLRVLKSELICELKKDEINDLITDDLIKLEE
ncbi:P24 [Diatraea saccharalis granulovirus]|uniref:p24 n=1 Tax=Diatraea saccharalis granulovirus TaxID=1675862 RepID=A0A0R7EYR8_9BBAC|nr:P24 [Diatraea saccharalis granulovirus]AKN80728.1 P24 [Diatraea saccharalis granulovirus]